jgi:hypothetical protein
LVSDISSSPISAPVMLVEVILGCKSNPLLEETSASPFGGLRLYLRTPNFSVLVSLSVSVSYTWFW